MAWSAGGGVNECYIGDVRDGLRSFIAAGIRAQTCVTSPPYWGLRDYGVPGQLGLEPTIAEYVANMVDVFRLVRDVLADDGTLWLNLGDSYAQPGSHVGRNDRDSLVRYDVARGFVADAEESRQERPGRGQARAMQDGLKPKDLCGVPWRVAFALQADGWYLRSDIIWAKPNPMPESVTDRPTKSHEYLFLLSKRERYYYDAAAIREASIATNAHDQTGGAACGLVPGANPQSGTRKSKKPDGWATHAGSHGSFHKNGRENGATGEIDFARNKRSVWTIATQPYADAHFAVMPRALVEPCILAGSRVGDVVLDCFLGSGTVAQVAQDLGRRWIGCELNGAYLPMQARRTAQAGLALGAA